MVLTASIEGLSQAHEVLRSMKVAIEASEVEVVAAMKRSALALCFDLP